jgi:hypothetical protein
MISGDTALQSSDETRTLFAQTMGLVAATAGLFALGHTSAAISRTGGAGCGSSRHSSA